jgi:hypothetical protein
VKEDARPLEKRTSEEPPVARDDVRLAVNRCPFCHEDVAVSDPEAVVCRQCLARQHGGCWSEAKACGACRGTEALVAKKAPLARRSGHPFAALAFVVTTIGLFGASAIIFAVRDARAREKLAFERTQLQRFRAPLVRNGQTLLVTDGERYGAVVFGTQEGRLLEQRSCTYYLREGSRIGPLGRVDQVSPTGTSLPGSVDFGPFGFRWSAEANGAGRVYLDGGLRFAVTDERIDAIDPRDPKWVFYDADGNPWSPPAR